MKAPLRLFLAVLVGLGASAPAASAQQVPAGPVVRYVVSQRILAETTDGKAEIARFQAAQQEKAAQLRVKQQAMEATRVQLAQAPDAAERTRLEKLELQQRTELERATAQAQGEMQALQRQMQSVVQTRVKAALDEVLKGQDVQLVLNFETTVVWSAPGSDITTAVVERMNALATRGN